MSQRIDVDALNIRHDSSTGRFYVQVLATSDAEVNYQLKTEGNPNVMVFTSTYIPDHLRSVGLADEMALTAMRFADTNNFKVKAKCPFISGYLNRNPQFESLRA